MMNCFKPTKPKSSPSKTPPKSNSEKPRNLIHNTLFRVPNCTVHLIEQGTAMELSHGDFTLLTISENSALLATVVKIGEDLQWPLTKDEPVVKIDSLHYLFTLPIKDGDPLSYGVAFSGEFEGELWRLDSFLQGNCCFSGMGSPAAPERRGVDWREYAPRIEEYNGVLAKAIAGGSGQIVRGIFMCTNAYANQVQKGGQMVLCRPQEKKNGVWESDGHGSTKSGGPTQKKNVHDSLKRARKLSRMTEKLSKTMLDSVGTGSGAVMAPLVQSRAGKAFLSTVPGEVLLASLDAVNKVFDAVEVAEKQAFSATSGAATRMVSNRFGESAGEATGDVLATAEQCANTAWNIFKIRKAITPSSGLKNAATKYR